METTKYFASQQEDERILIFTRGHIIVLFPLFLTMFLIYVLGLGAVFFLPAYIPFLAEGSAPNVISVVMSLYFLFGTLYFFIEWMLYYLKVGIVTNINLVDINQKSLFSRKISELNLDNIEDVSASENGFLQTMIHFGDVHIQTAGELPNFIYEKVPYPYEVARKIMELKESLLQLNQGKKFQEMQDFMKQSQTFTQQTDPSHNPNGQVNQVIPPNKEEFEG